MVRGTFAWNKARGFWHLSEEAQSSFADEQSILVCKSLLDKEQALVILENLRLWHSVGIHLYLANRVCDQLHRPSRR